MHKKHSDKLTALMTQLTAIKEQCDDVIRNRNRKIQELLGSYNLAGFEKTFFRNVWIDITNGMINLYYNDERNTPIYFAQNTQETFDQYYELIQAFCEYVSNNEYEQKKYEYETQIADYHERFKSLQ